MVISVVCGTPKLLSSMSRRFTGIGAGADTTVAGSLGSLFEEGCF